MADAAAGAEFREVTFDTQASQTLQILTETDVNFDLKSLQAPLGSPRYPNGAYRHPRGAQSDAKENALGAPGVRKGPKKTHSHAKKTK